MPDGVNLKLGRCPTPSPLTLAALPSMLLIPSAPFVDGALELREAA